MFENNIFLYKLYKHSLEKYEKKFEENNHKSLKHMVNLYIKLNKTFFHDLADSIELWVEHYGDNIILEYIKSKKDKRLIMLEDIIKSKLK